MENDKNYIVLSNVEKKEVEWLWYPYIPKAMVSIVQGDPKCGKTFMLIDIISRITRGDYKPLSKEKFEQGCVIFQNNDDPLEYSIVERFEKQGADKEKIIVIDEKKEKLYFNDLTRLEETIKEKKPQLVIFDPIQAFMGETDVNSQVQVRNTLKPLKKIAEDYNVAIVLVQHLKKGIEKKAIYKGVGSIDFVGFARSMLMVMKNEHNKEEKLLLHTCSNVTKEGNCLSYTINENGLVWLENKGDIDADKMIQQESDTKLEYAKNFILGCVASKKEISANELQGLCKIGSFSERTFNGARSILNKNKKIHQVKKNGKNYWCLNSQLEDKVQSCNVENEVINNE